jgi:hypothetical protein
MDTGHWPIFTRPGEPARILLDTAKTYAICEGIPKGGTHMSHIYFFDRFRSAGGDTSPSRSRLDAAIVEDGGGREL